MSIRASARSPRATMPSDVAAAASLKIAAAENARCNSCSDGIGCLKDGLRQCRLVEQNLERRYIGVPLDQRRLGAEACDRGPVQLPYLRRDAGAMGIDEAASALVESGEVYLGHGAARDCSEKSVRVEAVIDRVDVDVVDVEEQLAAGASGDGGDEFPFAHRIIVEAHVGRHIFDQQRPPESALHGVDAFANERQRFFGKWQRKKLVEVPAVDMAPAKMLRHRARVDPRYEMP